MHLRSWEHLPEQQSAMVLQEELSAPHASTAASRAPLDDELDELAPDDEPPDDEPPDDEPPEDALDEDEVLPLDELALVPPPSGPSPLCRPD